MKKYLNNFLVIVCLFVSLNLSAQNASLQTTIVHPSPTSKMFREFAGYTPDLSTGSVNIPIDLYDIKVGDFSIPISLQYYTSGIKVADDPYPAGYGWALFPALRITRTIMGRPDMQYPMQVDREDINEIYCKKAMYDWEHSRHGGWSREMLIDTQHDVFTIHLPNGNYTFFVEKVGDDYVAMTVDNLLKIIPKSPYSFEVIDEKGVVYYFGEDPASNVVAYTESRNCYDVTSWMLRKIVLPGLDNGIDFTWEKVRHAELMIEPFLGGDVVTDYKPRFNPPIASSEQPTYTTAGESGNYVYNYGFDVLHLKQISFSSGVVDFTYKSIKNPLITSISVKNRDAVMVRKIDFIYGTGFEERLLLSLNRSDLGGYQFEYYPERSTVPRDINSQDYWGYYNGKRNSSLVPRMEIRTYLDNFPTSKPIFQNYGDADRSVDAECMKAYTLTKVIYPTGGFSSFEYEPHSFQGKVPETEGLSVNCKRPLTMGGGLRVTKVITSAGNKSPEVVKLYRYGINENGLANVIYEPTLDTFIDERYGVEGEVVYTPVSHNVMVPSYTKAYHMRMLFLNTQSNYMRYVINTPAIWYDTVTEYTNDKSKTVYSFKRHIPENYFYSHQYSLDFQDRGVFRYTNLFSKGSLLVNKSDFVKMNDGYVLLRELRNNYVVRELFNGSFPFKNFFINRMIINTFSDGPDFDTYVTPLILYSASPFSCPTYIYNDYSISNCHEKLISQETIWYTVNGKISNMVNYDYKGPYLDSRSLTLSNGTMQTERFFYPKDREIVKNDVQRQILSAMCDNNIKSIPFKIIKETNNNLEETNTKFKNFGNNLFLPEKVYFKSNESDFFCKYIYDYDLKGNLRSSTQDSVYKKTYLWGYNSVYPVAVINGLNYSEVLNIVGQAGLDALNINVPSALKNIRVLLNNRGLMTSYTYIPLVGITSITNPHAQTIFYFYDNIGRLKRSEDNRNNKLKNFAYCRIGETMNASFSVATSYDYGSSVYVNAIVSGGSDSYGYLWTLKDDEGSVLYTSVSSNLPMASIPLERSGVLTLTCTVTDNMTKRIQNCSRKFMVSDPMIRFSNIIKGRDRVSGRIFCTEACILDFYLNTEISGEGTAKFNLAGESFIFLNADGKSVNISLQSGWNDFSLVLTNSSVGDKAGMYINGGGLDSRIDQPSCLEVEILD